MINDTKILVTDLDRTLLRNDESISEYSMNVLSECKNKDIKLVIATARPYRATVAYAEMLGCTDIVCLNGARIDINGRIYERNVLSAEDTNKIIGDILKLYPKCTLAVEVNDYFYYNFKLDEHTEAKKNNIKENFSNFSMCCDKIIYGLENSDEYEKISNILPNNVYARVSVGKLLQIQSTKATKYNAVKTLSDYYGIPINQVACFGDDNDDVEMIEKCGLGVAVSNAIQNVKNVADYIIESNEDDGVCKFIEKNIFK